jgi:hypothetical protein
MTHATKQGNKLRTERRPFTARLVIVRLASGELLINTPTIAGEGRASLVDVPD